MNPISLRGLVLQPVPLSSQLPHQDPTGEKFDDAIEAESDQRHASYLESRPQRDPCLYQVPRQPNRYQDKGRSSEGIGLKRQR